MPIRTLIVDDEPLARERIRSLLKNELDVEIVGECGDGKSAIRAINRKAPDLVLLDIQLPEMDGFEIIESIPAARLPAIVFVTAYDRFALKAFKVHAIDYLLKPVDTEQLGRALAHLRSRLDSGTQELRGRLIGLIGELEKRRGNSSRIVFKVDGDLICLRPSEIDWVESAGNYICLHVGGSTHIVRETMNEVEQKLQTHNFVRIHRSSIVNLERIKRLKAVLYGDYVVELRDGSKLAMSRVYRQQVLERIGGI